MNHEIIVEQNPWRVLIRNEGEVVVSVYPGEPIRDMAGMKEGEEIEFDGSVLVVTVEEDAVRFNWSGDGIRVRVHIAGYWYGMGEILNQRWPLNQVMMEEDDFLTVDNGRNGLSTVLEPVWFSDRGVALSVTSPFRLGMNQPPDEVLSKHEGIKTSYLSFDDRPWLDEGGQGNGMLSLAGDDLAMEVLLAEDLIEAHKKFIGRVGHPAKPPSLALLGEPVWTTWARFKDKINQETVLDFAREIKSHGFPYQVMEIDDRWQTQYGDLAFDPVLFPDPKGMIEELHELGFKVTLWTIPFLHPESEMGRSASEMGYVLQTAEGAPYRVRWWQGWAYLIDATNPHAMDWFGGKLKNFLAEYGLDGYKFDGGEAFFVPKDAIGSNLGNDLNEYTHAYINWAAGNFTFCEVRSGWKNQRSSIFFRLWDLWSTWSHGNGLRAIIPATLTLSLLGYPYSFPDMIGGNAYFAFPKSKILNWIIHRIVIPVVERMAKKEDVEGEDVSLGVSDVPSIFEKSTVFGYPTAELMIRWTQVNALMQVMQFSLMPWEFGDECERICRKYAELHLEFVPLFEDLAREAAKTGEPIIRPVFWLAQKDERALLCDDQFLVGDDIMVAPVVYSNKRERDIFIPPGRWVDYWSKQIFQGGQVLEKYPAPLDVLPFFVREGFAHSRKIKK